MITPAALTQSSWHNPEAFEYVGGIAAWVNYQTDQPRALIWVPHLIWFEREENRMYPGKYYAHQRTWPWEDIGALSVQRRVTPINNFWPDALTVKQIAADRVAKALVTLLMITTER